MSSSDSKNDLDNDLDNDPIVIVGAARTPMGGFQGDFSNVTAAELGAASIAGAISDAGVANEDVEEVIMGCVLPAGQGQAPARQAAFGAGLGTQTGCSGNCDKN